MYELRAHLVDAFIAHIMWDDFLQPSNFYRGHTHNLSTLYVYVYTIA